MGIVNNVCFLLGVTDRWGGCVLSALLCVMNAMYDLLAFLKRNENSKHAPLFLPYHILS